MKYLLKKWFKLKGWKIDGKVPEQVKKCVVVAAPHTSNWDFVYALAVFIMYNLPVRFLAKKELFVWPFKKMFISLGGMPVKRNKNTKMVESMVNLFAEQDELMLLIAAEGTRGWVEQWKSGFYNVAIAANVPILLGYLDYKTKTAGFSPMLYMTGDKAKDAATIQAFYADKTGKNPELFNINAIKFD